MIPRHHSPPPLGVLADVLGQVAVFLDEVPERLLVLVARERHVVELRTGRDIEQVHGAAVVGHRVLIFAALHVHGVGVARIGVAADVAELAGLVVKAEIRSAVFVGEAVAYVEQDTVGRYVGCESGFGYVRTVLVERVGAECRGYLVADTVDHVLGARIGVGRHYRQTEAPRLRQLCRNRSIVSVHVVGIGDQIGVDGLTLFVLDILAIPVDARFGLARELDAALFLDHAEFGDGHRIDVFVIDTLDIEVDIARQFEVQSQRGFPRRRHFELFVQNGRLRVGCQVLFLIGSAVYVFQHVADIGMERRHLIFSDLAFVKRQTVLDAVAVSGNRYEPYERQAAGEDARASAEDVFALAGHVPVEAYAGSHRKTCLGHVRGLVAAVVGESPREVLVLVVGDRRIDRNFEAQSDRSLETLAEIDLVLQVDRILHVGKLGKCLRECVIVAVGDTERQRSFVVLEIIPAFIDIISGTALQISVGCQIVFEL